MLTTQDKKIIKIMVCLSVLCALMFLLESLFGFPYLKINIEVLEKIDTIIIVIAFTTYLICQIIDKKNKKRKWLWVLSIIIAMLIGYAMKLTVKRSRNIGIAEGFAFPSGHSTALFSVLPFTEGKFFFAWLCTSILICSYRIIYGLHWPSDIIAGIIIGYSIGYIIKRLIK